LVIAAFVSLINGIYGVVKNYQVERTKGNTSLPCDIKLLFASWILGHILITAALVILSVKIGSGSEFGYIWAGSFLAGGTVLLTSHDIRMTRYVTRSALMRRKLVSTAPPRLVTVCRKFRPTMCLVVGIMCNFLSAAFAVGLALRLDCPEWLGDKVWWGFFIAYAIASFFEPLGTYGTIEIEVNASKKPSYFVGADTWCCCGWWLFFAFLAAVECGSMVLLALDIGEIADFDIIALSIKIVVTGIVTVMLIIPLLPCKCQMTKIHSQSPDGSKNGGNRA
jgi:hypothetical protein